MTLTRENRSAGRKPCIHPTHIPRPAVPGAARSKAWVCGRSLSGIAGSNAAGIHGCLSPVSVVCCQVEGSATGWSLIRRSPTECGVTEYDHEFIRDCRAMETKIKGSPYRAVNSLRLGYKKQIS